MKVKYRVVLLMVVVFAGCRQQSQKVSNPKAYTKDCTQVINYIVQGNAVYAQKSGYGAFAKSMLCYDSAFQIAQKSQDTLLMATSYYALGRAYDAWNKDPQKTIAFYTLAANYYEALPDKLYRALYLKHLVAHAYDKLQDSVNTIKTLTALYNKIIALPDSTKKTLDFTTEMALISSQVKNYALTQQILNRLTNRATIINDKESYDFLNHYYLTKARLAVYVDKAKASPYLDSLEYVLKTTHNITDSNYFAENLEKLFRATGNSQKIQYYTELSRNTFYKLNTPTGILGMQKTINQIENEAIQKEMALKKQQIKTRNIFGAALIGLLIIISALTLFLYKRSKEVRKRRNQLYASNQELAIKNQQNELLNKEIHHRIKNNLQIILSLVYMQERNTETDEVKDNMQSIRLRIESISNLHQQLMEQTDAINLNRYVQLLVTNVSNLLGDEKKIINHLQIQSLQVSQKISFPLGLIINEWMTNSVKYAKPQSGCLELFITIHNGNNAITVKYNDNGIAQTTKPAKKSLGLDIVNLLTRQLNGKLTVAPTNIFDYTLQIMLSDGE